MSKLLHPLAWPILAAALAYGLVEWLALSRSRLLDRVTGRRGLFFRR